MIFILDLVNKIAYPTTVHPPRIFNMKKASASFGLLTRANRVGKR
nr:MAG TPA: hypothetical protein [Caudoviricetes sp.]